jgi:hypothetical protein
MYLGAPMIHQRISKQSFAYLLDKMCKKLSGWKAKTLSFADGVEQFCHKLNNFVAISYGGPLRKPGKPI